MPNDISIWLIIDILHNTIEIWGMLTLIGKVSFHYIICLKPLLVMFMSMSMYLPVARIQNMLYCKIDHWTDVWIISSMQCYKLQICHINDWLLEAVPNISITSLRAHEGFCIECVWILSVVCRCQWFDGNIDLMIILNGSSDSFYRSHCIFFLCVLVLQATVAKNMQLVNYVMASMDEISPITIGVVECWWRGVNIDPIRLHLDYLLWSLFSCKLLMETRFFHHPIEFPTII